MAQKLFDAAALPSGPEPVWRWLVWYRPTFNNPPLDSHGVPIAGPAYLVHGTDDLEDAKARAADNSGCFVAQNPIWRTLN